MNSTDARTMRSRRALLDASIDMLIRNPSASLSEIASHAGVGRATLYRHFETREQLIQELARESLEMTDKAVAPIKQAQLKGRAALEAMFPLLMPLADRYHFLLSLWALAEKDKEVTRIYNHQLNQLATIIDQGKQAGELKPSMDTSWIVGLIDCVIYNGWWIMGNTGMSAEDAADHAIQSLFNGISTE